jgi:hypothetical protein
LLLFGPEGKTRVWLVVAGEAFYADRNGNGDLTEPGKRVYSVGNARSLTFLDSETQTFWLPVPENERIYQVGDIFDPTSRTWCNVTVRRAGRLETAFFEVLVDIGTRFRQLARLERFGDRPQDAPVIHFNGPLTIGLITSRLKRDPDGTELNAWFGTRVPAGANGAPARVIHDSAVPRDVFPVAWLDFHGQKPSSAPTRRTLSLSRRQGLVQFSGQVAVPKESGPEKVRVQLIMGNFANRPVTSLTTELPLVEVLPPPNR